MYCSCEPGAGVGGLVSSPRPLGWEMWDGYVGEGGTGLGEAGVDGEGRAGRGAHAPID